jgi:hypothetical protein
MRELLDTGNLLGKMSFLYKKVMDQIDLEIKGAVYKEKNVSVTHSVIVSRKQKKQIAT